MPLSFRTRKARIATIIFVVAVTSLVVVAWSLSKSKATNKIEPGPDSAEAADLHAVAVNTAEAVARQAPSFIQATGSFAADESSDVSSQVSGQVIATPVDVGAFVKRGAVIARLDDRDARLRLQQSLAAEKQAAAALRQAEVKLGLGEGGRFNASEIPEVRAARQNYEAAEAQARLAETNARRYESLVETGDVSRMVYDQARAQAETARAQANAAREQLEVTINVAKQNNQGIATAQAALESARAQAALARKAVSDATIVAPFAGFISDRPVAAGEYVTPASKIATLLRTNPIKLRLQLPEADAGRARVGMPVVATVTAYPNQEFNGEVTVINPAIDPTSRTVNVEVQISNQANLLRANMFATGRIMQPDGRQGVFIPRSAAFVNSTTGSAQVYVIEGNTARLRVVQLGEQDGELVRVVTGVSAGEVVATSDLDQLFDGVTVDRQ